MEALKLVFKLFLEVHQQLKDMTIPSLKLKGKKDKLDKIKLFSFNSFIFFMYTGSLTSVFLSKSHLIWEEILKCDSTSLRCCLFSFTRKT